MRIIKSDTKKCRNKRNARYFGQLQKATPSWLPIDAFRVINRDMRAMRAAGRNVHRDHIVPILSPIVCGLNVPWNLSLIDAGANIHKSNHFWPNHPCESVGLFDDPEQLNLFP